MTTGIRFKGLESDVAAMFTKYFGVEKTLAESIAVDGVFDEADTARLVKEWKRVWMFPTEQSLANTFGSRFATAAVIKKAGIDKDYLEDYFEDFLDDVFEEAAAYYSDGEDQVIEKSEEHSKDELGKLRNLFETYSNKKFTELYGTNTNEVGMVGEEMFEQIESFVDAAAITIKSNTVKDGDVTAGTLTLRIEDIPMAPGPIYDLLYNQIVQAPKFAPALYRKVTDVSAKVQPKEGRVIMVELNLHPIVGALIRALGRGYPKAYLHIKPKEFPKEGFEVFIEQIKFNSDERKQYGIVDLGEEEINTMSGSFKVSANGSGYDLVFQLSADPNVPFPQSLVEWEPAPGSIPATMRLAVSQVSKHLSSIHYFENCLRQQLRLAQEEKRSACYK